MFFVVVIGRRGQRCGEDEQRCPKYKEEGSISHGAHGLGTSGEEGICQAAP